MFNRKIVSVLVLAALVLAMMAGLIFLFILPAFLSGLWRSNRFTLNFTGIERTYFLHIPPAYDGKTAVALVIVLHGATEYPSGIESATRMSDKSDAEGFIVVYPEGIERSWNVGFGVGPAFSFNVDDVGFVRALIHNLRQRFTIDGNRIYVAGFSNGAMLAYRLAAELSDTIAAIAVSAGTIGGRATSSSSLVMIAEPAYPVSIIVFHSLGDALVPYDGGVGYEDRIYLSVNESVSFWVRYDGCYEKPLKEEKSGGIVKYTYSGGRDSTEVVLYASAGSAHEWPVPLATDEAWAFFKSHPRKG